MRTSQIFGSAGNTLLTFTNAGFRSIQPGDTVLLGYDGNVSAPSYRANFPSTNTASGNAYPKHLGNYNALAGSGKIEAPTAQNGYRDFVYDTETDSLYGVLDGFNQGANAYLPYFVRVSRTNGSLNNTTFCVPATGAGSTNFIGASSFYDIITPSLPVKIYDNGGTNDIWMYAAGSSQANWVTCNGSSGAMISNGILASGQPTQFVPWIKVANGYGVASFTQGGASAEGLVAFSVNAAGTAVTVGAVQTVSMLGVAAGAATTAIDLIPLGNTGTFLYYRADAGTYGTVYLVTLNTGNLTFTINATYALTTAQANFAGRDGSGFIFSPLNANNQIAFFQQKTALGPVMAGSLTLLTYSPTAKTLMIGNAVPILGPSGMAVQIPTPTGSLGRLGSGAHSMYDGYSFYYVEANCHLKIPFTGTAIAPQGIVAYSKEYSPVGGMPGAGSWAYASNANPSGTAYIPMFYATTGSVGSATFASGYWTAAEESIDNTFAYGVEIGVAVTAAAKGAAVTVAVKSSKLSASVGASGAVGALSSNGASIYVSPTQLFSIGDFDLVFPRLPATLQMYASGASPTLPDATLSVTAGAPAYKNPMMLFGSACNGLQNQTATKIENQRQSVFMMNSINWANGVASTSAGYATLYALLLSFDGIFMPQTGQSFVSGGNYVYSGNPYGQWSSWSFRNEFGCNRYDYNVSSSATANYSQVRFMTKD